MAGIAPPEKSLLHLFNDHVSYKRIEHFANLSCVEGGKHVQRLFTQSGPGRLVAFWPNFFNLRDSNAWSCKLHAVHI